LLCIARPGQRKRPPDDFEIKKNERAKIEMNIRTRREFIRDLGVSAAAAPFLFGLPGLAAAKPPTDKQRLIFMFSPNGTIPWEFWPDEQGEDFKFKRILAPLEPFKKKMLVLNGVSNRVRGDGDSHMRGMSCLLTGKELLPGNIQGGSHTPAGWAGGISIDQELKNFFQKQEATSTRFGSLEFGVGRIDRADPWTRMSYAGANKPIAPVNDPYHMFEKLYGSVEDRENLTAIMDGLRSELKKAANKLSPEDRRLLEEHAQFVSEMERDLKKASEQKLGVAPPTLKRGVSNENDNLPTLSKMQIDLLVNSFANDMARVATLQFTKSVGQAKMSWLGVKDTHHTLSHHKDDQKDSQESLVKINIWFAEQVKYLAERLEQTPEPGGSGSMLDHTTIVWTNELGKGNSHTLDNIPFVLLGNGCKFKMGRSMKYNKLAHNRLLMALAHSVGHRVETFGNPQLSAGGALDMG
jgi:hypothetical protein